MVDGASVIVWAMCDYLHWAPPAAQGHFDQFLGTLFLRSYSQNKELQSKNAAML